MKYRVFVLMDGYRYWFCGGHWSQWSWAGKLLTEQEARAVASEHGGVILPAKECETYATR